MAGIVYSPLLAEAPAIDKPTFELWNKAPTDVYYAVIKPNDPAWNKPWLATTQKLSQKLSYEGKNPYVALKINTSTPTRLFFIDKPSSKMSGKFYEFPANKTIYIRYKCDPLPCELGPQSGGTFSSKTEHGYPTGKNVKKQDIKLLGEGWPGTPGMWQSYSPDFVIAR